jgi:hypothetical protein
MENAKLKKFRRIQNGLLLIRVVATMIVVAVIIKIFL